jgi:hypothetical protein
VWQRVAYRCWAFVGRRLDAAERLAVSDLTMKLAALQESWQRERDEHNRVVRHLQEDLAIMQKQAELMTTIITRDRQRVEAEMAIHARRQREANDNPQFRDPGMV